MTSVRSINCGFSIWLPTDWCAPHKVRAHRKRLRQQGLRPIQIC
ncbi:MAG: hypothetical protein DMG30_23435 [Acidobacteria bacterium]|nr:MAG: hypothetical protein DMG30_23435 [Acidobacteriota bacterium]